MRVMNRPIQADRRRKERKSHVPGKQTESPPGTSGTFRGQAATALVGTFGASALIQASTIMQGIVIARLLGPVGRGEFTTVILWPDIFAALGIFGTNIALARSAARTDRCGAVTRTALLLALVTSTISSILCYFSLPYLFPKTEGHLLGLSRLFVAFIALNHFGLNLVAVDQGACRFRRFNFTRALLYPVYLGLLLLLWVSGANQVQDVVVSLLAANLLVVALRLAWAWKDMRSGAWSPPYHPFRVMRESIRFGLVGAALPLYAQADKAILLWLLGTKDLGLYVVALSVSMAVGSITDSAGLVSFTAAARAGRGHGFGEVTQMVRVSSLLWLVCGGILALGMPWLLPLVYGAEFAPAVTPARLLIAGSALAGLVNVLDQTLRGQGRAFVGLEGRIAALVMLVPLGYVLSRHWGLMGLCLAFTFCQLTCFCVFLRRILEHYDRNFWGLGAFVLRRRDIVELFRFVRRAGRSFRRPEILAPASDKPQGAVYSAAGPLAEPCGSEQIA
jgi:antigen flippase